MKTYGYTSAFNTSAASSTQGFKWAICCSHKMVSFHTSSIYYKRNDVSNSLLIPLLFWRQTGESTLYSGHQMTELKRRLLIFNGAYLFLSTQVLLTKFEKKPSKPSLQFWNIAKEARIIWEIRDFPFLTATTHRLKIGRVSFKDQC